MSDTEKYAPDEDEIVEVPSADYTIFYSDGEWFGLDDRGQFRLMQGAREHPENNSDDYNYDPCGAVLDCSYERYGEKRYCEAMAVGNFDTDKEYENDNLCKKHQGRNELMEQQEKNAKHLAFVKSYENIFQYLSAHKQLFAVETFKSLAEESKYEFEPETEYLEGDSSDSDLFGGDTFQMEFPVPTEHVSRAKALWFAALDYVRIENILEEQFRVAAEETGPDGEPLTVGERTTIVTVTENGQEIEDKDEHHLNLPLSRIQKDYERHLEVGGVSHDGEDEVSSGEAREWIVSVEDTQSDDRDTSDSVEFSPPSDET